MNMKKTIIISFIAIVGLASCSDFLNQEPKQYQSNELTLSTFDGLNKATEGTYGYLESVNWYGANFILSSELRGGNAKNPTNTQFTSGRYTGEYQWSFTANTTSPLWNMAYFTVAGANNVINNLDGKISSEVSAQDINNLKAENLFLRALSYFDLVITYAQPYTHDSTSLGVPVVLVSDVNNLPARNTVAEVYKRIVTDLTEAESIIATDYTRSDVTDATAVASKSAVQALLSRVYLYMGKWQNSANYATKVINSGNYSLFTADEYADQWGLNTPTKGGEVIFEVFGSKKDVYWGNWDVISYLTTPDGYADVASTADLRDLYDDNDVRGKLFVSATAAPDHFWTAKYPGKPGPVFPKENNIVVLRLSEMYLNRAEAIYNGAIIAGVTAESDLAAITSHRNADAETSASATAIQLERRKEFAFEGHIVYDLARTGTSLKRTDYNGSQNQNVDFPSYKWALPIPKREMDANPNMVQNEGY